MAIIILALAYLVVDSDSIEQVLALAYPAADSDSIEKVVLIDPAVDSDSTCLIA